MSTKKTDSFPVEQQKQELQENPLHDFRNFLYVVWKHLRLPNPTDVQYDIADYLQNGPKRSVIEAFRGVGKSYVTSAFVCHQLYMDPQVKILVVSASKSRADDFSTFTQRLINEMPILAHLRPRENQRNSKIAFDVGPAKASHSPSVKSAGITGQLAGSRADLIVADDVEIPSNSATQMMRDKLGEAVKEFDAVLKPDGRIIYLGTPQTEMSLYELLPDRGYEIRVWPARYPSEKQMEKMERRFAPSVLDAMAHDPEIVGKPVDPQRFSDTDLLERELSYGRSGFALQFMLDTSLSDMDRYPLKVSDLIVMSTNNDKAPEKLIWTKSPLMELKDLPNLALNGDKFYQPQETLGDWIDYTGSVMFIDPSGRGKDETAYCVTKMLNGFIYVTDLGGLTGGYNEETLEKLARIAKAQSVNLIRVESNFGDGMFLALLKPYLERIYPVTTEEVNSTKQKELRIIDTLEPVMNQHKLVLDMSVIEKDYKTIQQYPPDQGIKYSLIYQMTRITRDRGALRHDDRLDALEGSVAYWVEQMSVDAANIMEDRRQQLLEDELERFTYGCLHVGSNKPPKDNLWVGRR